jgi:hypothetical protein
MFTECALNVALGFQPVPVCLNESLFLQVFVGLMFTGAISSHLKSNLETFVIFVIFVPWAILFLAKANLVLSWLGRIWEVQMDLMYKKGG